MNLQHNSITSEASKLSIKLPMMKRNVIENNIKMILPTNANLLQMQPKPNQVRKQKVC